MYFDPHSFHSLHHTQFRTNYSLFMPIYDSIYGTMDKSSDSLYETSIEREEEKADVVHLTHLTSPESIYHLRLGFASLAASPHSSKSSGYLWMMWPFTIGSVLFTWLCGHSFVLERNTFNKLNLQSWVIPRFYVQVRALPPYIYICIYISRGIISGYVCICSIYCHGDEKQ